MTIDIGTKLLVALIVFVMGWVLGSLCRMVAAQATAEAKTKSRKAEEDARVIIATATAEKVRAEAGVIAARMVLDIRDRGITKEDLEKAARDVSGLKVQ